MSSWTPDKTKLVKVCLHSRGEDVETPWAEDLGPDDRGAGFRRVRLANVPFLHAKPTYGDVIVVEPDDDAGGRLTWDRDGVDFEDIGKRLCEDAGRWAMIADYRLDYGATDLTASFRALCDQAEKFDIIVEGCFEPREGRPGRVYFAVPKTMSTYAVLGNLDTLDGGIHLMLVHPPHPDD